MTIAKDGRTLDTGSIDLYDSFEGQIDKQGNIISSLKINIMFGEDSAPLIDLYGSIDSQFQGKWDSSWDVILEFKKKAKKHTLFDGRYSFTLSRYNEDEGIKRLGNGYIEINNGIMTVAKDGRTLDTGSIDLYDSFEGQIDKQGNIVSSLKIDIMFGKDAATLVDLYGSIDSQFQGKWDSSWDVILEFGKKALEFGKKAKGHTISDGRYSFNILRQGVQATKSIGSGYIEINNGIMTVAKDGRNINVDSVDLYDSFKGRIDKKGNISARFTMYPMCGAFRLQDLEFNGNINAQLKTKCGESTGFDLYALLELKKEQ
jgi:hypothetical protein